MGILIASFNIMKKAEKVAGFQAGGHRSHFSQKEYQYRSFQPSPVNQPYQWQDERIPVLLEESVRFVGELNAYSTLIPDVDFFIEMHVFSEAVKSSRIEGTKTGIDEAVLPKAQIAPEKRDDWLEVQNYVAALNHSIDRLRELPVCVRLLKEAHKILMEDVRGGHKQPGEIRMMQNWIGGTSIQTASFIPPHQDSLPELLSDLEYFWNNNKLHMPHLIKIALSHYQFETIHPFNDGNGRIGRMLITLHLIKLDILQKPTLYLSDFFERNKGAYYDALTFVRDRNDMDQWIIFFLSAVTETAKKSKDTLEKIVELRKDYDRRIIGGGKRAKHAHELLLQLFSHPVITVAEAAEHLQVSTSTANTLINWLERENILQKVANQSRNRIFCLHEYLALFSE